MPEAQGILPSVRNTIHLRAPTLERSYTNKVHRWDVHTNKCEFTIEKEFAQGTVNGGRDLRNEIEEGEKEGDYRWEKAKCICVHR